MAESKEIWKDIPEYEGLYKVSSFGRVKSIPRLIKRNNGVFLTKTKLLKGTKDFYGYIIVGLYKDGKSKNFKVHILVAMAFLTHVPNGFKNVIHHIDHDKQNNNIKNIRIISHRKNVSIGSGQKRTSDYLGVYLSSDGKKWCSRITIDKKRVFLGRFNSEKEAAKAYRNKLKFI